MFQNNICHFVPFHKDYHSIHSINFVMEKNPEAMKVLRTDAVYKMHLVCDGNGFLHTTGQINPICKGDVFFTFPASPFKIIPEDNLSYMYISFIGTRGNMLMEKFGINNKKNVHKGFEELCDFWEQGLSFSSTLQDIASESVLLYTFAKIGQGIEIQDGDNTQKSSAVPAIKKCIDDNFSDPSFSLDTIRRELSYNKKYISSVFKKHMGTGVTEYVNTIRIQQACNMLQQGYTCISDVAYKCGFSDAQYFSKVFKKQIGITPTLYVKELKKIC